MKDKTSKINKIVYFQVISARTHYWVAIARGGPEITQYMETTRTLGDHINDLTPTKSWD